MTKQSESDSPKKSGPTKNAAPIKSAAGKKSAQRPGGRKFRADFQWGEVDDVEQEAESLIVPTKAPKKRYRPEKIETTLTATSPQEGTYKNRKAQRPTLSAVDLGEDPAPPSYGRLFGESDDEFDVFLRRAEEAEKKEQLRSASASGRKGEPKRTDVRKSSSNVPPPNSTSSDSTQSRVSEPKRDVKKESESVRAESHSPSNEPKRNRPKSLPQAEVPRNRSAQVSDVLGVSETLGVPDVLRENRRNRVARDPAQKNSPNKPRDVAPIERSPDGLVARIRAKVSGKLRKFGFTDAQIRGMVPHKLDAMAALELLERLLDERLALSDRPSSEQRALPERVLPDQRVSDRRDGRATSVSDSVAPIPPVSEVKKSDDPSPPSSRQEKPREATRPEAKPREPKHETERPESKQTKSGREIRPSSRKTSPVREEPVAKHSETPATKQPPVAESSEADSFRFGDLDLSRPMLDMLREAGYLAPTPIQAGTIPRVMADVDVMAQSKTGSGKTAAFMIPIIEGIESCEPGNDPVALVVAPTRELAVQIKDETAKLARNRDIATVACYGGKPIAGQIAKIRAGVDIVVGTPGRIIDLTKRQALSLSRLRWVVLDEADRMLDIGFRPDIERILKLTPPSRQTLLFSATLPEPVTRLAQRYMREPESLDFSANDIAAETIEQFYITVDRERKFEALLQLLHREKPEQAIVFCRTKRMVDKLGRGLTHQFSEGVAAIHGDLAQSQRDSIMRGFRAGQTRILVATDVVGRGIDVSGISHIINYDIPQFCDDYVHRVGRTGRMGREGTAFTLVTSQEGAELTRIEMRINRLLRRVELKGFETYARPESSEEPTEPKEQKTVFGKPTRRIRRAL